MSAEPYTVKSLMKHQSVSINRIHLEPGHTIPQHSHDGDYVVHPHQDTTLEKATYKGGVQTGTETVTHSAGVPYFVSKSEDGTEFTITNTGSAAMMCDKILLPPKS